MLTQIGLRLKVLYLIHAEEIDERAIKTISRHCNNLETLGLYLCDFIDNVVREEEDDFYYRRREKEDMEHVEVDPLSLHGACPTLLGIKASEVSAGFIIILASVIYLHFPPQWISNKWIREGAQVT